MVVPAMTSSGRVITPSTRVQEAMGSASNTSTEEKPSAKDGNKDALKKMYQYLENTYREVKELKEGLIKQEATIREQSAIIQEQSSVIKGLQTQMEAIQNQSRGECKQIREQLETIVSTANCIHPKAQQSYASMVDSQLSHQQDAPLGPLEPPTSASTLFCTIDTSHVGEEDKSKTQIANVRQLIEKEVRGSEETKNWRCASTI